MEPTQLWLLLQQLQTNRQALLDRVQNVAPISVTLPTEKSATVSTQVPATTALPARQARLGGTNKPFGGLIESVRFCHCSRNFLIEIGPPRGTAYWGMPFLYTPGQTTLYEFRNILQEGSWTLGLFSSAPDMCVTGGDCRVTIPGFPIVMVGTSK